MKCDVDEELHKQHKAAIGDHTAADNKEVPLADAANQPHHCGGDQANAAHHHIQKKQTEVNLQRSFVFAVTALWLRQATGIWQNSFPSAGI